MAHLGEDTRDKYRRQHSRSMIATNLGKSVDVESVLGHARRLVVHRRGPGVVDEASCIGSMSLEF